MTDSQQPGRAASSYQRQEILSESPVALVARLYDMAQLEVSRARAALVKEDWAAKGVAVHRATNCLSLLQCSLNLERGGEVAANLDRILAYLVRRLSEAHVQRDERIFSEITDHLKELASAWREIAQRPEASDAESPGAAPPVRELATP
jgi:flagellar protein FliS